MPFATALERHGLPAPVSGAVQKVLRLDRLDDLYSQVVSGTDSKLPFERLLDILNIRVQVNPVDLKHIPATGPAVLVANHPFGFIEGCVLAAILPRIRPDVKIMANSLLSAFAGLSDHFLFVNPFGGVDAARENRKGLRAAVEHMRKGGMLVVFPAGEVAHWDLEQRGVVDPVWNAGAAGIARITGAPVIPTYFSGSNSRLFHLLGFIHPRLRTAMLPHEFLNKQSSTIDLRIGSAIPSSRIARFDSDVDATAYLRRRTYLLKHRADAVPETQSGGDRLPVEAPVCPDQMAAEVAALPADRALVSADALHVYTAESHEIPGVLREIGRLREITFRKAGEGTGKPLDIDAFDAHYMHLFLWNSETREVAGAYRLAAVNRVRQTIGINGLYTRTLFQYGDEFLNKLGSGVELGRSFVRPEYQKNYTPLLLLWKAIAGWVCRNPACPVLFGPVSISNDYASVSRQLMVSYFSEQGSDAELSALVKARRPLRSKPVAKEGMEYWDLEDLSAVIADIETDGKGLPILLRQYLKLGGKLISFNVDHKFSNALDGLIAVDLRRTERRVLERYMGKAAAAEFLTAQTSIANAVSVR